ncbi:tryptophan 2,3-dioxygenase family protein [Kribbella sp. NBC_00359]|uniref:tryptophan 2,3-dioxygenase family protein n=1 Tax=Kribbella sp. NBC_00359 TaxID=2975966 RepID=UPI002E211933
MRNGRGSAYSDYLCLDRILDAQHPRADGDLGCTEHFFIVAHQISELLAKQVLLDCAAGARLMESAQADPAAARGVLVRASAIVDLMTAHLRVLLKMSPRQFAQFRPLLGHASGAQSRQLHELFSYLGIQGGTGLLMSAYLGLLSRHELELETVYSPSSGTGVLFDLAEALATIAEASWVWQITHIQVAHHMLGSALGTGGSDGVDHLMRRAVFPFPALWAAKTAALASNQAHANGSAGVGFPGRDDPGRTS